MSRLLDGLTLPSKSKEDLEIAFHPALAVKYKEVLSIETDDPRSHKTLLLLGVGTHRFRISILWSWFYRRRQQEAQPNQ